MIKKTNAATGPIISYGKERKVYIINLLSIKFVLVFVCVFVILFIFYIENNKTEKSKQKKNKYFSIIFSIRTTGVWDKQKL